MVDKNPTMTMTFWIVFLSGVSMPSKDVSALSKDVSTSCWY
jgi:hypothetical protein